MPWTGHALHEWFRDSEEERKEHSSDSPRNNYQNGTRPARKAFALALSV